MFTNDLIQQLKFKANAGSHVWSEVRELMIEAAERLETQHKELEAIEYEIDRFIQQIEKLR